MVPYVQYLALRELIIGLLLYCRLAESAETMRAYEDALTIYIRLQKNLSKMLGLSHPQTKRVLNKCDELARRIQAIQRSAAQAEQAAAAAEKARSAL